MALTAYEKLCMRLFGRTAQRMSEKSPDLKREMERAHMEVRPEVYFATVVMNTIIAFIMGVLIFITAALIFWPINPSIVAIFITIPIIFTGFTYSMYIALPMIKVSSRAKLIDFKLPQATSFMAIMASSNVEIPEIFKSLAEREVYGEVQKEALWIYLDISMMGQDVITALRNGITRSPSTKFQDFLQGIITLINSGGSLKSYLRRQSERYRDSAKFDLMARVEFFGTIAESYVSVAIIGPLLILTVLMVMAVVSDAVTAIYAVIALIFVITPLLHLLYIFITMHFETESLGVVRIKYSKKELFLLVFCFILAAVLGTLAILQGSYRLDLAFFAVMLLIGPYGYLSYHRVRQIRSIDDRFPDFLRDVAEDRRVGASLMQSIKNASEGDYGHLTPFIKKSAVLVSWKVSLMEVLKQLAKAVPTTTILECVDIIEKGFEGGGNISDILIDTAAYARHRSEIIKERARKMSVYLVIIYLTFIVFLMVSILLNNMLIPVILEIVESSPILSRQSVAFATPQFYTFLFVGAAAIQALGGGIVCGMLMERHISSGLRHSFNMIFIAYLVFAILVI